MRKAAFLVALGLAVALPAANATAQEEAPAPVKGVGSVELSDAPGDMGPMSSSSGEEPPLDVVKLALRSDGSRLHVAATLKDPPGRFASAVVELYVDTDAKSETGAEIDFGKQKGFEYLVRLKMCIQYEGGGKACTGAAGETPQKRWGAVEVDRYKGKEQFDREDVVESMGFSGSKVSATVPVTGQVVEASVEYADLKVKPGQTLRILARETGGSPTEGKGTFPWVELTLK
jgi:hypothetical protein